MCRKVFVGAVVVAAAGYFIANATLGGRPYNYKTLAHLKRLGVMFHAYHEKKGHFPQPICAIPKEKSSIAGEPCY